MFRGIIVAGAIALLVLALSSFAAAQSASTKTLELIAQLDKTKHKVKDKGRVHLEMYTEVRNQPVAMKPSDLTGRYAIYEAGEYSLDVTAASDGTATATGTIYETVGGNSVPVAFTFSGRIDGPLLTGTRTMANGRREPFEAVFVNRIVRQGTNADDARVAYQGFGIGFVEKEHGMTHNIFMEKK